MADARITQDVVEILSQPAPPAARVTQAVMEVLTSAVVVSVPERVQPFVILPC